jgi:peptide methionine sulfoxide reductase msrA/msrB
VERQYKPLTVAEQRVIVNKGTEPPFSGRYVEHKADGTYHCKRCGAALFASQAKFDSGTGWPSFEAALPSAVERLPDTDGERTEIVCARCGAHLGHVFEHEGFTEKNVRHCVNSVSLDFQPANGTSSVPLEPAVAYFAGGCFWGVEYHFEQVPGVIDAVSGYMGGTVDDPSYEQVCTTETGHAETVKVTYDPARVSYAELARLFFEIHDPTQIDRQGPDVGTQYRSAVFVESEAQRKTVLGLIRQLDAKGLRVATEVVEKKRFWQAEEYHQDYCAKTGKTPYCHSRVKRFDY